MQHICRWVCDLTHASPVAPACCCRPDGKYLTGNGIEAKIVKGDQGWGPVSATEPAAVHAGAPPLLLACIDYRRHWCHALCRTRHTCTTCCTSAGHHQSCHHNLCPTACMPTCIVAGLVLLQVQYHVVDAFLVPKFRW
jgi:hypothetical protein